MRRSLMSDHPIWVAPLVLAVGGATLLAGCGSSSKASSAPTVNPTSAAPATSSAAPATTAPASSAAAATEVTATETEFKIALSQSTFTAGTYTFKATNAGKFPHALTIVGPGVASVATENLSPGKSGSVTVTLTSGSYEIYCPVDGHKGLGMDLHVTVT